VEGRIYKLRHRQMKYVLYTSVLDESKYDSSIVSDIVIKARKDNQKHNITGVLLFDGHVFTQYIEGDNKDVDSLIENILFDKRHKNVFIIAVGETKQRLYETWKLGYIDLSSQEHESKNVISKNDLNIKAFHMLIDRFVCGGS
jgi:hypothetical protein